FPPANTSPLEMGVAHRAADGRRQCAGSARPAGMVNRKRLSLRAAIRHAAHAQWRAGCCADFLGWGAGGAIAPSNPAAPVRGASYRTLRTILYIDRRITRRAYLCTFRAVHVSLYRV